MSKKDQATTMNVEEEPMGKKSATEKKTKTNSPTEIQASQVTKLEGHVSEVFMCSWNPKKKNVIASGSADNTARIWTIPDGPCGKKSADEAMKNCLVLRHEHNGATKDVTTIDWNNTGNLLATGTLDGIARIWDLKGNCKFKFEKHRGAIFSLKWSKNGEYLLSGSVDSSTIVWDTVNGVMKQQFNFHTLSTLDVDWKNEDTFASCASDKNIYVCQIGKSTPLKEFAAHDDEVNTIRWSPDGRILASCSDDKTAKMWSMTQSKPLHSLTDHTKEIYTIRWSPSGPGSKNPNSNLLLASASFDSTVKLWDAETGKCVRTLTKNTPDPVYSVAFSPDGQFIATGSIDRNVNIYSVKDGSFINTCQGTGGIFEVCWNYTGDKVAACFSNNLVSVLDFKV